MKMELDCKQFSRLISDGMDQDLPEAEKARMRLHFLICSQCRTVEEQMDFLRRAMRKMGQGDRRDP